MDLYDILQNHIALYLLVLTRISGIFFMSPFLGSRNIPDKIRVTIAVSMSFVIFPMILQSAVVEIPDSLIAFLFIIATELFVGWLIGFVASLVFSAIHMAGQLLDMQVGFGVVNVLDPTTGQQVPIIGAFKYNLAIIVFLVTNGHHLLITALVESFKMVPVLGAVIQVSITAIITDLVWSIFTIAFKISIPVLMAIILTDVALGVLARTMPQMNIFVVGIPAKIFVGLFVLSFVLPFYILFLDVAFNEMYGNILLALRALR